MDEHDRGDFEPLTNQPSPQPGQAATEGSASGQPQTSNVNNHPAMVAPPQPLNASTDGHRNLMISVAAILGLAVIVGLIYWFSLRHHTNAPTSTTQPASSQNASSSSSLKTHIDPSTKTYNSPNFNLAFSYPADWTIADTGNGVMTAKSPTLNLTNAAGQSQQGIINLTLRTKGSATPEFNKGAATATRDSVKMTYAKPTQNQRTSTYLSYLRYAPTGTNGALDGVYITGGLGYQNGQAIPASDVSQIDPIISISFADTSGTAMSISDSSWNDSNLSGPLVKMLESFAIN